MNNTQKRIVRIRKSAQRGKEVSIPSAMPFILGQDVLQVYSPEGLFVLIVPQNIEVNEEVLKFAIKDNGKSITSQEAI